MNSPLTMIGIILILVLGGVGALLYIANTTEPPQTEREEVISNDRFPG